MKTQLLTLTKTLLTMGAIVGTMATSYGHEDEKNKNGPIVPIDQPIFIQVGLEINIKCQAKDEDGNDYVLNFHLTKKAQLDPKKNSHALNYYLTPDEYAAFSFYGNPVNKDLVTPDAIGGYFVKATISGTSVQGQSSIAADDYQDTRVGHIETNAVIQIPAVTSSSDSMHVFSMAKTTIKTSFINGKKPQIIHSSITFTETNCVYF